MKKTTFHILVSLVLIAAFLPLSWSAEEPADDELLANLALFAETLAHTQQAHLDQPEAKTLIEGAIKGMLRTLDPYSQLMPDYAKFRMENQGNYAGLGMTIGIRDDVLTVITPFKGSPASLAGMQNGDVISHIEGESTAVMSLDDAVSQLRGEPGTSVSITVIRAEAGSPIELTVTREVIRIPSVEKNVIGDNIGYIKLNQFLGTTANDVDNALTEFSQNNARGVILDMRLNPGGSLSASVDIASDFLQEGQLVVYSKGIDKREDFVAKGPSRDNAFPLIVLVNGGSASASEIVAGAIKDHGRGLVMGDKTFGKASVQRIFQLTNSKAAVKLTVARYFTPNGTNIDKVGITPDVKSAWFSRSEQLMQLKLRDHGQLNTFIEENGDDVLTQLAEAERAPRDDRQAAKLLRQYQRLTDALTEEQIVLSDLGIKYAIARITENSRDELEHDPQIVAALEQFKVIEFFQKSR